MKKLQGSKKKLNVASESYIIGVNVGSTMLKYKVYNQHRISVSFTSEKLASVIFYSDVLRLKENNLISYHGTQFLVIGFNTTLQRCLFIYTSSKIRIVLTKYRKHIKALNFLLFKNLRAEK